MSESETVKIESIPLPDEQGIVRRTDVRAIYKGEVCPYVKLEGKIAKQYVGYETIKRDLSDCSAILKYLVGDNLDNPILQNALWESFITKYGRCFASTKGRGIKLEAKDIEKNAEDIISEANRELIQERNEFSAHAGISESDLVEGKLALMPPKLGKKLLQLYISRVHVIKAQPEIIAIYQRLIAHVTEHVDNKLDGIYERLKKEMSSKDIDSLYEKSSYILA